MTLYNIGPGQTYETFAAFHGAITPAPGDIIDGGDNLFREKIVMPGSGASGNMIAYRNVKLSGAQVLSNASFNKTSGRTNVYEAVFDLASFGFLEPMVWEDDIRLNQQASIADTDSNPGSFYYDAVGDMLYVHTSDSSVIQTNGKVYEVPKETENVDTNQKDYLLLENFDCTKTSGDNANTVGGIEVTGSNCIFRNCRSHNHRRHCFIFYNYATDNIAENCTFFDTWVSSVMVFFSATNTRNILRDSTLYNSYDNGVVYMHGGTTQNLVENCNVYNETGWASDEMNLIWSEDSNSEFRNNRIYGWGNDNALRLDGDGNKVIGNVFDGTSIQEALIYLNGALNTEIYHNALINPNVDYYALWLNGVCTGTKFKNNIMANGGRGFYVTTGNDVGWESDNNCIFNMSIRVGSWLGSYASDLSAWQTATSGDANSIDSDPKISAAGLLESASPCIDSGDWVTGINDGGEAFRNDRKVYGVPNIGPDQKAGAPSGGGSNGLWPSWMAFG